MITWSRPKHKWTSHYFVELGSAEDAIACARELTKRGYTRLEAFTPYAIPELDDAVGIARSKIPRAAFCAGLTGSCLAYLILWWTSAVDYPVMVGGRPFNSLPAHIPIIFETTVLLTGLTSFFLALLLSRLPALYHPVFEVDGFERTTIDRYWIGIGDGDPKFEPSIGDELAAMPEMRALGVRRAETGVPVAELRT